MSEKTKSEEQLLVDYEKVCDTYPVHACSHKRRFTITFNVNCINKTVFGIDITSKSECDSAIDAVRLLEGTTNIEVISFHSPTDISNYYSLVMYCNKKDQFNIANIFACALRLNMLTITRYEY